MNKLVGGITLVIGWLFLITNTILGTLLNCDYAVSGQLGYQDPATIGLLNVMELYDRIMYYLVVILVVVLWFFIASLKGRIFPANFKDGELIELFYTLTPALILWAIGIPSLKLLYSLDEVLDSEITVKAIGNQWYWDYEYEGTTGSPIQVSSFMLDDASLNPGDLRLLTTDNSLVLPCFTSIRLLVTSNDVIHSFAVPSLGLKCDAIPGRLNSAAFMLHRPSDYFGQCSELCGILHGFMPISITGVTIPEYIQYLETA